MKTLFFILIALSANLTFANDDYTIETKKFSASHVKEGESFVALIAFEKAVDKAHKAGYDCPTNYMYSAGRTITGKWKAVAEVECYKRVYSK